MEHGWRAKSIRLFYGPIATAAQADDPQSAAASRAQTGAAYAPPPLQALKQDLSLPTSIHPGQYATPLDPSPDLVD